ncbi:AAA family ATPase [Symbioplanes lichenis]|uniref:AAA family ATPase n=1 Tax=Symbioplanes lichenis TaxID=1629072 RepID=UPI002739905F|nr:ATP-binding protein [Actinoplanes lichenis]
MLVRFEVSNFRSIAAPVELSMVAVDRDREQARDLPQLGESLLTLAAVYGPNASGKSNIVSALAWLRDAVHDSLRMWEDSVPLDPFAFGSGPSSPSGFVFEAAIDGVRFEYVLELTQEKIDYEGLFHYPEKKRRRIFERDDLELKLQRGLGALSGVRELLTEQTLALSVARRFNEPLVSRFATELLTMQTFGLESQRGRSRYPRTLPRPGRATMRWFEEAAEQPSLLAESDVDGDKERALAMLRLADLGIEDVLIDDERAAFPSLSENPSVRRLRLVHRAGGSTAPLDYHAESQGTRTWFDLIGPVLTALRQGSIVVFDELDASLHPTLSAELLRIFGSAVLNPRGAQLIFTTHDTSLLSHLNRDEVWLTEKHRDGSTRLGALAEFAGERVRRSQNLEKAYLHGRFGALPEVDDTEFLQALGLIG